MLTKSKTCWNTKKQKKDVEKHKKYQTQEKNMGRRMEARENHSLPEPEHNWKPYNTTPDPLLRVSRYPWVEITRQQWKCRQKCSK